MKKSKTMWIPVYKCERCGKEIAAKQPQYNAYGMSQFPDVNAPESIAHRCARDRVGIAYLVGLNEVPNTTLCTTGGR